MTKFLVLYRTTVSSKDQMMGATPEQMKAGMDAWMAWFKKVGPAIVDGGAPLGESALIKGKTGSGHIGGYTILQAKSIDAAKKLLDGHPHFGAPGASIEVIEILPTPGM